MYTIDAVNYPYDITRPQPQLFVTPDFQNLVNVLDEFAHTLSCRKGGASSLQKAIDCHLPCTAVYRSGLQVSGVFKGVINNGEIRYIETTGPTALAYRNRELPGRGKAFYGTGFISPVGKLKNYNRLPEDFSLSEWTSMGVEQGKPVVLEFENSIVLNATVTEIFDRDDKILLIRFSNGALKDDKSGTVLFGFEDSVFDMATGAAIVSVFSGAADKDAFEQAALVPEEMPVSDYTVQRIALHQLYQRVRNVREGKSRIDDLDRVWEALQAHHADDWLCPLEILELLRTYNIQVQVQKQIEAHLQKLSADHPGFSKLIKDGFNTMQQIEVVPVR
ncbi:MAG: hypothetical protein QM640_02085 [Niabella sp.]